MNPLPANKNNWYAIRTFSNRELKLQKALKNKGLKTFIPNRYEKIVEDEVQKYVEKSAIHNLVFVYSTKEIIDDLKNQIDITFHYVNECGTYSPAVIPESEMELFIKVTELAKENIIYLRDDFDRFKTYSHIRVTGGRFEGLEGYLVRIRRDRKVVFLLKDITAVAITGIDRSLIELVD